MEDRAERVRCRKLGQTGGSRATGEQAYPLKALLPAFKTVGKMTQGCKRHFTHDGQPIGIEPAGE